MTNIPILMYHSVSQESTSRFLKFTISPRRFAQHMEYLSDQGYTSMTVEEYAQQICAINPVLPLKPIIITFDDGFGDFFDVALPILQRFDHKASLYVVVDAVDGTSRWLKPEGEENRKMVTWSQLSEINRAGIECGAHSNTHLHLDTAKPDIAHQEIVRSRDVLEQKLGSPVYSFAYPYGHYTKDVRRLVIDAGYKAACAVRNAMSHTGDDLFSLARITIQHQTDIECLRNLLSNHSLSLASVHEKPWISAWRQVRRTWQFLSRASK